MDIFHFIRNCSINDMVEFMNTYSIDINQKNEDGDTLLHNFTMNNIFIIIEPTEKISILLKRGANVNLKNKDGCIPLHYASCEGSLEWVTLLLEYGSNINDQEPVYKNTPLHYASHYRHMDIVKLLLSRGADYTLKNSVGNDGLSNINEYTRKKLIEKYALLVDKECDT